MDSFDNAITRNSRAAAVQAGQLQAILEKGAAALRQLAEDRGKQLAEVQRLGYVQAASAAESRASAATAEAAKASASAAALEEKLSSRTTLLVLAAAGVGAYWWWSARPRKR